MNWASASEFFAMGGYGLYVWGSYGLMAIVLAVEIALTLRRHRQAQAAVAALNLHNLLNPQTERQPGSSPP
jgi:heme exporter protein D